MKGVFIETTSFTERVIELLPDDLYAEVQRELMDHPTCGTVMPGCGGLRKLRTADPRRKKGKRGGTRLIYLHVPEANQFYMLDLYSKDEKDDLSPEEKRVLKQLAERLKEEARNSVSHSKPEDD